MYVIISGSLGEKMIKQLSGYLGITSINVFCFNLEYHRKWSSQYSKVSSVTNSFDEVLASLTEQINSVKFIGGCNILDLHNKLL